MKPRIKNIDNYIFDLDGTIVNSSKEVLRCIKLAYKETNIDVDQNRITPDVIGPPLKGIFKLISPEISDEASFDRLEEAYSKHYDHSINDSSSMYPGILEILNKLKEQNKKLFIATNKPQIATLRILKMFNLDYFTDVYTIDKYSDRELNKEEMIKEILEKYLLDKSKTVMIGDSPHDSIAGNKNGITTIGVLWGYGSEKQKLIEASDYAFSTASELAEFI